MFLGGVGFTRVRSFPLVGGVAFDVWTDDYKNTRVCVCVCMCVLGTLGFLV